jgi:hypothetical protein
MPTHKAQITFGVLLPFSGRFTPPEFALGLAGLQFPLNTSHVFLSVKGPNRALNRINLVKSAIKHRCKYVFFVDDDMTVPMDAVKKLFMALETADDDVVACGGVYTSKTIPSEPLVYLEEDGGPHWKWRVNDVFSCQGIGTGCLMIKASMFEKIPEPWFRDINSVAEIGDDPSISVPGNYEFRMTDDLYWCRKVEQAGLKILAHGGVLPVHWDQQGNPYTLPRDSYPMENAGDQWFAPFGVIEANLINPDTAAPGFGMIGGVKLPDGFLSQKEADALMDLAAGKTVLEMGAFRGRSTVAMALSAKSVTSVDWHEGASEIPQYGSTLEQYRKNIAPYPNVEPIVGRFEDVLPAMKGREFDLVFVDGEHSKESVIRDMKLAIAFKPDVIAVHDWGLFEVTEGLETFGVAPEKVVDTLAIFDGAKFAA